MFGRLGGLFRRRSGSEDQLFAGGLADATLQADVWLSLLIADQLAAEGDADDEPCDERQLASIEILGELGVTDAGEWDGGPWAELWTVDRCGTLVPYTVDFSAAEGGGTAFSIREEIPLAPPNAGAVER